MHPALRGADRTMDTIDVFALARGAGVVAGELALARMPRLASSLVRLDGAIAFRCQGEIDTLGRPALRLALKATLPLRCDRCGDPVDFKLDVERLFFFVRTEEELAAVAIDETPEEPLLGSAHFGLAGLIEDEAILQLPISPRHDGCQAARGAATRPPDGPFAGLAALRGVLRGSEPPPARDARTNEPAQGTPRARRGRRGVS